MSMHFTMSFLKTRSSQLTSQGFGASWVSCKHSQKGGEASFAPEHCRGVTKGIEMQVSMRQEARISCRVSKTNSTGVISGSIVKKLATLHRRLYYLWDLPTWPLGTRVNQLSTLTKTRSTLLRMKYDTNKMQNEWVMNLKMRQNREMQSIFNHWIILTILYVDLVFSINTLVDPFFFYISCVHSMACILVFTVYSEEPWQEPLLACT